MSDVISRSRLIAGTAAALSALPRAARGETLEPIRIAGVLTEDFCAVTYAIATGLYRKAGLDVQIVSTSSGTAATNAVVSGAYELGKGSPIAAILAHLRGLPLVVVANQGIWSPRIAFNRMVVAVDSPVKTGADLNGKIGGSPGLNDLNTLGMSVWIDKNGGDSKTLKWIELPNSVATAALAEHRVDVASLIEPQLTADLETGKVRVLADAYSAIAERFVFGAFFANADWAAKHADAVNKWVRVTYESGAYTNTHHAETAKMMADFTKIPLPVMQKIARIEAGTLATSDPALFQPLIEAAAKYKNIPRSFPAKEMFFQANHPTK